MRILIYILLTIAALGCIGSLGGILMGEFGGLVTFLFWALMFYLSWGSLRRVN